MNFDIRPFDMRDKYRLRHFRCAEKKDSRYAKRVNFILKKHLVHTLNDRAFNARAFVAIDHGEMVGIAALAQTSRGYWELLAIGVSVGARRQGVGRALLQHAVAQTPECWKSPLLFQIHRDNEKMRTLVAEFGVVSMTGPDDQGYMMTLVDPHSILRGLTLENEGYEVGRAASQRNSVSAQL